MNSSLERKEEWTNGCGGRLSVVQVVLMMMGILIEVPPFEMQPLLSRSRFIRILAVCCCVARRRNEPEVRIMRQRSDAFIQRDSAFIAASISIHKEVSME
eukprot:scaffold135302_cov69-Cyclotella_meneghiniana.AAC.10